MNRRVLGVIIGVAVIAIAAVLYLVRGTPAHPADATNGRTAASARHVGTAAAATGARSSIRGHVVDHKGPVAGASVCASTRGGRQTCATTNADGAYAIENLSATAYRVTALAAQHRPATFGVGTPAGSWVVLGVGEARDKVDVVLRAGVLLSGIVQDINAGAIAGAQVRVQTAGGFDTLGEKRRFWSPPVVSDKDGAFQLWVEPGSVNVMAVADGYGESSVDAEAPTSVVILLTPEGSISGTVVDPGGQPVAEATVVARSLDMTRRRSPLRTGRSRSTTSKRRRSRSPPTRQAASARRVGMSRSRSESRPP